jgi:hypothetical protein
MNSRCLHWGIVIVTINEWIIIERSYAFT